MADPNQIIVLRAVELVASVSKDVERRALAARTEVNGGPAAPRGSFSRPLVAPLAFAELVAAIEEHYPGVIAHTRDS